MKKLFSGQSQPGSSHGAAKLTEEAVLEIRKLYTEAILTQAQLGFRFGVSQYLISLIIARKAWKHI